MLKMTRSAALAAVLLVAGGPVVPARRAGAGRNPLHRLPPRRAAAAPRRAAAPAAAAARCRATEVVDNPYGLEALWKGGDIVARITLRHPGHHVDGQLVRHHHQGVRAVQDGPPGAGRGQVVLDGALRARRAPTG